MRSAALPFLMALLAMSLTAHRASAETLSASVMEIPPWGYTDRNTGHAAGLYSDILERLIRTAGYEPVLAIRPYIRVSKDMASGASRVTLMSDNHRIRAAAIAIATLRPLDIVVIGSGGAALTDPAQLQGKRIATLSGVEHHLLLKDIPGIAFEFSPSTEGQFKMLAAGRVDYVLGVREALAYGLRTSPFAGREHVADGLLIGHWTARLWQTRTGYDAKLSARLTAALKAMQDSGAIEAAFRMYAD